MYMDTDKETKISEEEYNKLKQLNYTSKIQINSENTTLDKLEMFLENTTETNQTEKWNRLDKTTKIKKMSEFVEKYTEENSCTEEEKDLLNNYLRECLDKKKLSRVKDVEYDNTTYQLISIPGLQYNKSSKKYTIKNIDEKRSMSICKSLPNRKTVKVKRDI